MLRHEVAALRHTHPRPGLNWTDVEVIRDAAGVPRLEIRGTVAGAASQRGIRRWHVSLSHDAGMSIAMVVAEA